MRDIKDFKIAITGHRPSKLNGDYELKSPLVQWIKSEILLTVEREKPTQLISGMALGIDTLFALIGLELQIPVLAAIPCNGQERMWPVASQQRYRMILQNPLVTTHIVSPGPYSVWKMQKRNEWMVDNCWKLIAVWDGTDGGTGNCVEYAENVNRPIIRINPDDFKNI